MGCGNVANGCAVVVFVSAVVLLCGICEDTGAACLLHSIGSRHQLDLVGKEGSVLRIFYQNVREL